MEKMRAAVVDHDAPGHVAVREVSAPVPYPDEALVRMKATSLNLGEVRYARSREPGGLIGWDLAGVVEKRADDGSGPDAGARVVGHVGKGAWAELVKVPTDALAELPDQVSFEDAATLPVAGLTALHVLEKNTGLLERKVLITGANGGVGIYACQLAKMMGARVVAQVRREQYVDFVKQFGADEVAVTEDGAAVRKHGPYRLIAESIGGSMLANCMVSLAPDGICVAFGNSSQSETTFDISSFYPAKRASLYAFLMFNELCLEPASEGLGRLATLLADGKLRTQITVREKFEHVGEVARDLWDRKIPGKAVVTM